MFWQRSAPLEINSPEEMPFLSTALYDSSELTYVTQVTYDERSTFVALWVKFSGIEISAAFKYSSIFLATQPFQFHYTIFYLSITLQWILCNSLKTV